MRVIGLTGGIGCGKSTVTHYLETYHVPVIDADQIAREVVEQGQPALKQIVDHFGQSVLDEAGDLNRSALGTLVFNDAVALSVLEGFLHPAIRTAILERIEAYKTLDNVTESKPSYILVDIPLLIEKGYAAIVDMIVVVDCLPKQQVERVGQRDGRTAEDIQRIMDQQCTREQRLAVADVVLDNTGDSIDPLLAQIESLHREWSAK